MDGRQLSEQAFMTKFPNLSCHRCLVRLSMAEEEQDQEIKGIHYSAFENESSGKPPIWPPGALDALFQKIKQRSSGKEKAEETAKDAEFKE